MLRLAIIEDSRTKLRLVEGIFAKDPRYDIVATGHDRQAGQTVPAMGPDLVLVDRVLPDGDGLELADVLAGQMPFARVYLYSSSDPPPLLPARVGYVRDEDVALWPQLLDPVGVLPDPMVRHPRK